MHTVPPQLQAAAYLSRLECLSRGDLAGASAVRGGRVSKAARDAAEAMLAEAENEEAMLKESGAALEARRAALAEADRREHAARTRQPVTCHVQVRGQLGV